MAALQNSMPSLHHTLFTNSFPQRGLQKLSHGAFLCCKTSVPLHVWGEHLSSPPAAASSSSQFQDSGGRRRMIAVGIIAPLVSIVDRTPIAFAAETKKGFLPVTDKKDGYTFLYPFGWQEVVIEGQDKVFKDVIEPLESVSVNMIPTSKQDIRDFGSPQEVAETLIKKVLAPPTQKTKLIQAGEHDVDGKTYYTFEFVTQAPNYTRHALTAVSIGNGHGFNTYFYCSSMRKKLLNWKDKDGNTALHVAAYNQPQDCIQVEMLLLYYVAKDEKGFLSKEAVRGSWSTFPKCTRTLTERPINFHFLLISPK